MSEEMIVRHCAPTLAGLKTGNLFACSFSSTQEMRRCIRSWNNALVEKGVRVLPLRHQNNRALIYVYRASRLSKDLQRDGVKRLLLLWGYPCEDPNRCIVRLIQRLKESEEFPHEIGLFLGYPPEDVHGFIKNKACGCKCVGCWKVYGDAEAAQKLFIKYKKCTEVYCAQFAKGKTIERLTVAG